jgi:O-antigen/teichoic acid export membrane protein
MNMNDLVVARVMGFGPAAILSRAQGVMNLFHREALGAVRSVAFPAFARVHRAGGDLEAAHVESLGGVTAAGWTFYGFVAIFPLEILRFLFGPQWDAAAPLVPIFSLAGAMAAVWSLVSSVLLATGRVDLNMRAELVVQPLRILLLIGVVLYLRNLAGYAWTFALVFGVCIPVLFWFKQKIVPTAVVPMFRILSRSAIATACALVAPVAVKLFVPGPISVPVLLSAGFCTAASWVLAIVLVGHPLATHLPWVRNVLGRSKIPRTSA